MINQSDERTPLQLLKFLVEMSIKSRSVMIIIILFVIISASNAEKIVIVGAGLSGLTAAYRTLQAVYSDDTLRNYYSDFDIDIYEAKERVGGRIFTVSLNGYAVELGGENIHDGADALFMRRMLKEMNLPTQSYNILADSLASDSFFYDHENNVSRKIEFKLLKSILNVFPDRDEVRMFVSHLASQSNSMQDFLDAFINFIEKESNFSNPEGYRILKAALTERLIGFEGGALDKLSPIYAHITFSGLIESLLFDDFDTVDNGSLKLIKDDNVINMPFESVEGGNSKLPYAIADRIGTQRINLVAPLLELSSNRDGLSLRFGNIKDRVEADMVILTMPCPVYKNIKFGRNTIPQEKLKRINSIAYGTHSKILTSLVGDESDGSETCISSKGMTSWFNYDRSIATLFFGGALGVMKSDMDYSKSLDIGMRSLKAAKLMVASLDSSVPPVPRIPFSSFANVTTFSWTNDPYTQGSYSYYSGEMRNDLEVDVESYGERMLPLFTPIDGRIFFAGEHTTVHRSIRGSMEAAIESGEKVARVVIQQLREKMNKNKQLYKEVEYEEVILASADGVAEAEEKPLPLFKPLPRRFLKL